MDRKKVFFCLRVGKHRKYIKKYKRNFPISYSFFMVVVV